MRVSASKRIRLTFIFCFLSLLQLWTETLNAAPTESNPSHPDSPPAGLPVSPPDSPKAKAPLPPPRANTLGSTSTSTSTGTLGILLDRLEASVNSTLIFHSDLKKFRSLVRLQAQLDPLFAGTPLAAKQGQASDQEIVDFLIDKALIAQHFPKTDGEVEADIKNIETNNHLSRNELKEALSREGYLFVDYFELIRSSSQTRELIDREIRPKVIISDDDIKNHFFNHYTRSSASHRAFHIQMITISKDSFKNAALANQAAMQALRDLKSGEPFEEVAKRISDDASATSGGDLGVLTEDQMSPAIQDEIKKLQIGQISGILGGGASKRFFILKLKDVNSNENERLEKMKEEIRNQLFAAEYQHQVSLWLERQRQAAFIHRAGEPAIKGLPSMLSK